MRIAATVTLLVFVLGCSGRAVADTDTKLQRLRTSVRGAKSPLADLLERYGDVAVYNAERQAVQVSCTEGRIILSVPLTPEQISLMSE